MESSMVANSIKVVPYDPLWNELFKTQAECIQQILGSNCITIHHIGSTSIPDLAAKPIIDMLPIVRDISTVDEAAMEELGFNAKGEYGILFRRFFQKQGFNVHIFQEDNAAIEGHLKFRDWMRTHAEDKDAYQKLKQDLALQYPNDILNYSIGKDAFVADILAKTQFKGLRIVNALMPREWEAAKYFRQHYFFDKIPVVDPYTWTFEDKKHLHFILYQGAQIIGYAHIQLWPSQRAALRIIVLDESYRNHGLGGKFLKDCERWLKQHNIVSLHMESSPEAHAFYLKYGYMEMPFNDPDYPKQFSQDIDMGKIL
ncbi:MAG: GNAT family N-acetyltransferase [Gammaproteobacteria bacterium 39-13]|nr:GNAT family N-acetyltransferase [Gammaproteobacteria bacterium]OJV96762.1 MAG: GNAT family N-acetyltransferase [Gammaproteobacteria bacterium 39-13]